jgi:L-malate glycosyltransferase
MNILFLTHQGGMAGSTFSIFYLARGLAQRGHRVAVGCPENVLLAELLQTTDVIHIPMTFAGKFDRHNMRQIRNAVREYDIQLINAQSGLDRYTSIFAKMFYRLNVAVVHTRRQKPMSMDFFVQTWLYHHGTDKIIAVSRGVKEGLIRLGIPAEHILVIPNGTPREKYEHIDPHLVADLRKKYALQADEQVIGCVSRLKQQEQLLEALSFIPRRLVIIFVGIENIPNVTLPETSGQRIIFAGNLPQEQALAHFLLFDIKVLASNMEGLSQALLEAMALGVPVIATNASGNPDLIRDGENGLLFEENNSRQLAEKIEMLLDNQALRQKLAENGRRTALEEFSIEKTIQRHEQAYLEIMGSRHEKK